ncbi:MAG: carboxypeptidase-like regulatory domain-containing protein, partial [Elusimicrobiales bacterium]|nr:carboxypeptidase-like regulatory domain-containing protein [Elusimicrobiales bacterium]
AASSVSGRPVEQDGTWRVGPLAPDSVYDVHLRQDAWDMAYLNAGSQNYAPAVSAQHYLSAGEVKDAGIIALNQGQSITGAVTGPSGEPLPNMTMTAVPALVGEMAAVRTQTGGDGSYTLWVSSYISRYFDITAGFREENFEGAGGSQLYGARTLRVDLQRSSSAYFTLEPLLGGVTGQVLTADSGALSYPYGAQKGYPAAAVYLQRTDLVPVVNPLGDIAAMTGAGGAFEVPGLSTGTYSLKVVSLGYIVHSSSVSVTTGTASAGTITLVRGASAFGSLRKPDPDSPSGYVCPNDSEVAGIAAADEDFTEFITGTVETDEAARAVCSYEITGFKPGRSYHIALLGASGEETGFPAEGAGVVFEARESTSSRLLNLTYRPAEPECLPTFKYLGNGQVQLKFRCNRALRNETGLDNDLDYILSLTTYTSAGAALTGADGSGEFLGADKRLMEGRRNLTAVYRPAP